MAEYKDKHFQRRLNDAKARKANWDNLLDQCYDLFLPDRQTIYTEEKGNDRRINLFDSTGCNALQEFANNLKQMLLPSNEVWGELKPGMDLDVLKESGAIDKDQFDEVGRNLSIANKILFRYIWQSNFDQSVHESIQDMAISTGAMMITDTGDPSNPLNFESIPANEFYLESDKNVFREHKVFARDIYELFPRAEKDSEIDKVIKDNPNEKLDLCELTEWIFKDKNYRYTVYVKKAERKKFFEATYQESPWVVFRANVSPGEIMGRGPAIKSLPDMRTLNQLSAQMLRNNDMAVNPPLITNETAGGLDISNININPGSILPTAPDMTSGNQRPYEYLQTGASFQNGLMSIDQYQKSIERAFQLPQLGDIDRGAKTATEISIRNAQALSQQAALFGRLNTELVQKIVKRCYSIVKNYNELLPNDLELNGNRISIVSSSPLSKVQKQKDTESTLNFLNLAMSMGEPGQAMLATTLKVGEIGTYLADSMGVPVDLKLSEDEKKQQQEVMEQAAMQAQQGGMNGA